MLFLELRGDTMKEQIYRLLGSDGFQSRAERHAAVLNAPVVWARSPSERNTNCIVKHSASPLTEFDLFSYVSGTQTEFPISLDSSVYCHGVQEEFQS